MKIGIIDIGSNTIKAFIYECNPDLSIITSIDQEIVHAKLMNFIMSDELNKSGIEVLDTSIGILLNFLHNKGVTTIYTFATEAMRNSHNAHEVCTEIEKKYNINIDILNGKAEALCDFLSLDFFNDKSDIIGTDMGGGSIQIFYSMNNNLDYYESFPLGALKMKNKFVKNEFPTSEECHDISIYTKEKLSPINNNITTKYEVLNVMGGNNVTLKKIFKSSSINIDRKIFHLNDLYDLKQKLNKMNNLYEFLTKYASGRQYAIMPGLEVLINICEYTNIDRLNILDCGVREGYLLMKHKNSKI